MSDSESGEQDQRLNNQRALRRHQLSGVVEVYDVADASYLGRLVNIHSEGLMLMGDVLMSIDKLYQLTVNLPQPLIVNDKVFKKIDIAIDCLWVRESGDGSPHWAGCRIIDASDEPLAVVDKLVELWGD